MNGEALVTGLLAMVVVCLIICRGLFFLKTKGAIGDQWPEFQRGENKKYRKKNFPGTNIQKSSKG